MELEHGKAVGLFYTLTFLLLVLQVDSMLRLCGEALPKALDDICHMNEFKGFNTKVKRSFAQELNEIDYDIAAAARLGNVGHISNPDVNLEGQTLLRRMLGESAYQLMKTRRRRLDGVSDECCRKACTYDELIAYCRT